MAETDNTFIRILLMIEERRKQPRPDTHPDTERQIEREAQRVDGLDGRR